MSTVAVACYMFQCSRSDAMHQVRCLGNAHTKNSCSDMSPDHFLVRLDWKVVGPLFSFLVLGYRLFLCFSSYTIGSTKKPKSFTYKQKHTCRLYKINI